MTPQQSLNDLLDFSGYDVAFTFPREGEEDVVVKVRCRRLPFSTVARLISRLTVTLQAEMRITSDDVAAKIRAFAEGGADSKTATERRAFGYGVIAQVLPSILSLIHESPEILHAVLRDVVVDITDAQIAALPAEVALQIIAEAFNRTDKAVIAQQVTNLFFGVTGVVKTVGVLIQQAE